MTFPNKKRDKILGSLQCKYMVPVKNLDKSCGDKAITHILFPQCYLDRGNIEGQKDDG